jgi:DNA mismatch repair ATPase MutS
MKRALLPVFAAPAFLDKADMAAAKAGISSDARKAGAANTGSNARFILRAKALGHPLMHRDRCVRNDIDMEKRPFFIIITGANMAGKSTYLRTIGVNYLLACTGMPVCAEEMEVYPARLITSLRTSDSLTDNESYFFAELKRLKLIIDKLQAGEELFIILDEILKGTNSMDKQKGSFALIKQFMALEADGIIATHDLLLGTLIDLFPENIRNFRFEADITDNELTFSYRLRPGVAQNMNACFQMKPNGSPVVRKVVNWEN